MRITILIFLLALGMSQKSQAQNPFLTLKFDKVIICDFENNGESYFPIIDKNGQLTSVVKKHAQLDIQMINKLNLKLGDKKSYGRVEADCFEPHLGILYYENNKVVGEVDICLSCNRLSSTIDIPAQKQNKVGEGDKAYYLGDGLSKSFRQFLNGILKKYNFSHQIQPGSHFDN